MKKQIGNRNGRQTNAKVNGKPQVVCNKCGRNMNQLRPKMKKVGDLEYTYIKCRRCGAVFVAAVTDPPLREAIANLRALTASIETARTELKKLRADKTVAREIVTAKEKAIEAAIRDAQKHKDMNVKRSRELRERYPLNTKEVRL